MNVGDAVFQGISLALMMRSCKVAEQCRLVPTIILGVLAWCALFLPRMLIWPNPDQNTQWWLLLIGALAFVGGPLLALVLTKRKKR